MSEKADIKEQYERFLTQLRLENAALFELYKFFFAIDAALIAVVFLGKIPEKLDAVNYLAMVAGFIISVIWILALHKQLAWRAEWIRKIRLIEGRLGLEGEEQLWPIQERKWIIAVWERIKGKEGVWFFLMMLPTGMAVIWFTFTIRMTEALGTNIPTLNYWVAILGIITPLVYALLKKD